MLRSFLCCDQQRFAIFIGSVGLYLILCIAGCSSVSPKSLGNSPVQHGVMAPEFALPKVTGGWHSLKDFRGRTVILHFWSPWCVTCGPELQSLQLLHSRYKDQITVLAVSVGASFDDVRKFVLMNHLSLPILVEGNKREVSQLYNVELLPVSFVINSEGRQVAIWDDQAKIKSERIEGVRHWSTPSLVQELLLVK
jgi:peroxiredoxin